MKFYIKIIALLIILLIGIKTLLAQQIIDINIHFSLCTVSLNKSLLKNDFYILDQNTRVVAPKDIAIKVMGANFVWDENKNSIRIKSDETFLKGNILIQNDNQWYAFWNIELSLMNLNNEYISEIEFVLSSRSYFNFYKVQEFDKLVHNLSYDFKYHGCRDGNIDQIQIKTKPKSYLSTHFIPSLIKVRYYEILRNN